MGMFSSISNWLFGTGYSSQGSDISAGIEPSFGAMSFSSTDFDDYGFEDVSRHQSDHHDDGFDINPATGLPMMDGITDVGGNTYGFSDNDLLSHHNMDDFGSGFDF